VLLATTEFGMNSPIKNTKINTNKEGLLDRTHILSSLQGYLGFAFGNDVIKQDFANYLTFNGSLGYFNHKQITGQIGRFRYWLIDNLLSAQVRLSDHRRLNR
jgi:hypothetical protein